MPVPAIITWEQGLNAFVKAVYPTYPWAGAAFGLALQRAVALSVPADMDPAPVSPAQYRAWLAATLQSFYSPAAGSSSEAKEVFKAADTLFLLLCVDSAWNVLFAAGLVEFNAATAGLASSPVLAPNKNLFPPALSVVLGDGVV